MSKTGTVSGSTTRRVRVHHAGRRTEDCFVHFIGARGRRFHDAAEGEKVEVDIVQGQKGGR